MSRLFPSTAMLTSLAGAETAWLDAATPPPAGRALVDPGFWLGVGLGALLGAFVWRWWRDRRRRAAIERLVAERTGELRRQADHLRAMTNGARDAIIAMDTKGAIAHWNPAAEALLGYGSAEALGRDLHELLAPRMHRAAYQLHAHRFHQSGMGNAVGRLIELEAVRKDGSNCPIELSLSAMATENGWGAVGVVRDITERKRTEARLLRLNDCLISLGPDYRDNVDRITALCGEIFDADSALYNRLGDGALVALGQWRTPPDMPDRDDPQGHICYDLIRGVPSIGCSAAQSADGERRQDRLCIPDLSVTAYSRTDPIMSRFGLRAYFGHLVRCGDEPVGSLCVVFREVRSPTDEELRLLAILASALSVEERRHQATQALTCSQKRLALATQGAGIGIWNYHPESKCLNGDERTCALFGMVASQGGSPAALWLRHVLPADRRRLRLAFAATARQRRNLHVEFRVHSTGTGVRHLATIGLVVRDDSRDREHIVGVCFDITASKVTEAELRAAKEIAERASRAKSEFLSQMTHELRTPMNAVLGFAQLLECDPHLNDEQRDNLREILTAGNHLLMLINDILDLARVDSGHIEVNLIDVDLDQAVQEVMTLVKPLAERQRVSMRSECEAPARARADSHRLRQVLVNLLSNAVKYNSRPGEVRLRIAPANPAGMIRVGIRDTGPGIAADQVAGLFEPFERLPAANHARTAGNGIGLAVARRLVDLMGGRIGVNSEPGEGSEFWFELPVADAGSGARTDPA